jgi:transcriptional regulator with XRE-family HTH domain
MLDMTIGDRLRQLREKANLTLEQGGAIAGTSKQSMSQIEKGVTKEPGGAALYAWANYYGVDLKWLITGQGIPKSASQSVGIDAEILADAMKLLRALGAITGDGPEAATDPKRIAVAYQVILEDGGAVSDDKVIDFTARLAAKLRETADDGTDRQADSGTGRATGSSNGRRRGAP